MARDSKPWYRTRNLVLVAVVAALAWLTYAITWAYTATPYDAFDFPGWIAERRPDRDRIHGLGEPNAYQLLIDAGTVAYEVRSLEVASSIQSGATSGVRGSDLYDGLPLRERGWPEADRQLTLGFLERLEAAGFEDLIADAAAAKRYEPPPISLLAIETPLLDLSAQRFVVRHCTIRMAIATEDADDDALVDWLRKAVAICEHAHTREWIIAMLTANWCEFLCFEQVAYAVVERRWSPVALRRIDEILSRADGPGSLKRVLDFERAAAIDTLDAFYDRNGRMLYASFDEVASWGSSTLPKIANLAGFAIIDRRAAERSINDYFDVVAEQTQPSHGEVLWENLGPAVEARVERTLVLDWQYLSYEQVGEAVASIDAVRQGVRVLLAIERFRAEHEALPASLDQLVDVGLVDTVINPTTDEPYVFLTDRDATGLSDDDPRDYLLLTKEVGVADDPITGWKDPEELGDELINKRARLHETVDW
ncbi:MAG: hypothetical protein CMJ31_04515 [Phycisphaerae bacterium]|nr:hypothetical protein [Phycisphaerae bacterium]